MHDAEIIEAFHMMWDNFPERARLIRKDRTVLAVNKAAALEGFKTGERCIDSPPKEGHKGCKANTALREKCGIYDIGTDGTRIRFWVPLEGSDCEEMYVHFSLPVSIADSEETPDTVMK